MTESEFELAAEQVLAHLETVLDGTELDYTRLGGVLEIELTDGAKVIVNRHGPNREIWVAARQGGYHFAWDGSRWFSQREQCALWPLLGELLGDGQGGPLAFEPVANP